MGEEPYYIDLLSDYIVAQALTEDERDFNLTILYGPQTTGEEVINAAKRYPMMAERQVVVVREAQSLPHKEVLAFYAQKPMPTTVLVLCHKNGTLDGRTNMAKDIRKAGIVFESNKLYDRELPGFVSSYVKRKGVEIAPDACLILCEHVGADLSRLAGELDKLIVAVGEGHRIVAQAIQDNIGISKEYNSFELTTALSMKDVVKANRIVKYFDSNQKAGSLFAVLPNLFSYFQNLMIAWYTPNKADKNALLTSLELRNPWQLKEYEIGLRNYSAMKTMQIISKIREVDAKSKGLDNRETSSGDLLKELVFFILH
jgi:DNA polymerase-3 subunit delta